MIGSHRVVIQNKRVRYDFVIKRNLTIIKGDSATGKTTLVDMIAEAVDNPSDTSIEITCDKKCYVVRGATWEGQIRTIQDSIVFIDEGNEFVSLAEFASVIQESDNYYVLVTRQDLPDLPYSVDEIYGIRTSGKYGDLKRTYNEFYRIYTQFNSKKIKPHKIITEDSNSGFQFFSGAIAQDSDFRCISANGKSNVFSVAEKAEAPTLIIADGAAFGPEMDKIYKLARQNTNLILFLPESFEWMILNAGVISSDVYSEKNIATILDKPEEYIESRKYFSWERFFTELLVQVTQKTYLRYNKKKLNPVYLNDKIRDRILAILRDGNIDI